MDKSLNIDPVGLDQICRRHRIRRLSLFGSVLKGRARLDSDVDMLVEFMPDARPTFLDMAQNRNSRCWSAAGASICAPPKT